MKVWLVVENGMNEASGAVLGVFSSHELAREEAIKAGWYYRNPENVEHRIYELELDEAKPIKID